MLPSAGASWYYTSDERVKKDIADCDLGIDFINKVRPIKFKWNRQDETITTQMYGFSYQQIKNILDKNNIEYTGLIDNSGEYGAVAQTTLIPSMVKALQDLDKKYTEMKVEFDALKNSLNQ